MSQLLCFIHLFDHLACVGFKSKEFLAQTIDELRMRPCVGDCFCVGNVAVEEISVNGFITRKAASICKLSHTRAKTEAFNFLVKIVAGASSFGSKFLQTNTKERTSRSGRKVCDALGFLKARYDFFGHVFGWLYCSSVWVDHFAVFPQSDFLAVGTDLHKVFNRLVKLKKVRRVCGFVMVVVSPMDSQSFCSLVQLWNHLILKNTGNPAVGTGENIQ